MTHIPFTIGAVMLACQVNVYSLELILSEELEVDSGVALSKQAGGKFFTVAITLLQYLFIVLVSGLRAIYVRPKATAPLKLLGVPILLAFRPLRLPIGLTALCALMFWFVSCGGNFVLEYKVSIPVHATFRSSSLISNLLVGFAFFNRRYSRGQLMCAVGVTIGLTVLTLFRESTSASKLVAEGSTCCEDGASSVAAAVVVDDGAQYTIGILLLLATVVVSSVLGQLQEAIFSGVREKEAAALLKFDSRGNSTCDTRQQPIPPLPLWREMLLLVHLLALPLFVPHAARIQRELLLIPTSAYMYLTVNVLTQYVCISHVHKLAELTSPFTLTLTITLRKFCSLMVSIVMFGHYRRFSGAEWMALLLVVASASSYPFVPGPSNGDAKPAAIEKATTKKHQ